MTFSIVRMTDFSFLLEDEMGVTFPADFLNRAAAETVAVALNRLESSRHEPIRIVLDDKPAMTPGRSQPSKKLKITLDGYSKPKDKTLTISVRDESPAPAPKTKMRVTL